MSVLAKCVKTRQLIREHIPGANILRRIYLFFDVAWASVLYGGAIDDYFHYRFYLRKHADRKNFIVWRKRRRIINLCNAIEDRDIFNLKPRFYKVFSSYLGREWLDLTQATLEEFAAFVSLHPRFFVKPVQGAFGIGARIQTISGQDDLEEVYRSLQQERVVVEELVEQCAELAEFNPPTVNTLRLVTLLLPDGTVKVMTANLRCGRGDRCADNFHHQGLAATIDVATGTVITQGMDRTCQQYGCHPVTGKLFAGFTVPLWDKVLATVTAAAQVVPTIRYVGWDIAIGKDGKIIIIEGNCAAGQDVTQMPDQVGKWPLYKQELGL